MSDPVADCIGAALAGDGRAAFQVWQALCFRQRHEVRRRLETAARAMGWPPRHRLPAACTMLA